METDLIFDVQWRSQQGSKTPDNRDYGGVAIRPDSALCVVADGSTFSRDSGQLAQRIVVHLVDWYVEANIEFSTEALIEQLRQVHAILSKAFVASSASYAILHLDETQQARTIHAGDCLIGQSLEASSIQWQIKPHTLVNALQDMPVTEIAKSVVRNKLTRSFRAKEFLAPSIKTIQVENSPLILATDGFWAELSKEQQSAFIAGHEIEITPACDDKSILCIGTSDKAGRECVLSQENFYLRK